MPITRATTRAQRTAAHPTTDDHAGTVHSAPSAHTEQGTLPNLRATTRAQHTAEHPTTDDNAGIVHAAPSAHTEQGALPTLDTVSENDRIRDLLETSLPRTNSHGIGRFALDASRVLENFHLDTVAPLTSPRLHENFPIGDPMTNCNTNTTAHLQMNSFYEALVFVLKQLGAKQEEAARWAMIHVCQDDRAALSSSTARLIDEAVHRTTIMFPHLVPQRDTAGQGNQNVQAGVPTVGRTSNSTATMCSDGARFTISYPPKFNPEKSNWFLWYPQVERFLTRVKLDPKILIADNCEAFTDNQHATVLSIITETSPPSDTEWFARLHFTKAHQAWHELERAYAPRAELELQAKLEALDSATQSEGESIREWTLRLRRLTLEIRAMNGQHVLTETAHKLKLLKIRPVPGAEEGYTTFLASIRYSLHLKTIEQIERELIAYEEGLQMQTRINSTSTIPQVWHTRAGTSTAPTNATLPTTATFKTKQGVCYVCYNATPPVPEKDARHHMRDCPRKNTPLAQRVREIMDAYRANRSSSKPTPKPKAKFEPRKRPGTGDS
jgi:hypothetical protein